MKTQTRESAITHAIAAYPNESCGLVVIVDGVEQYHACRNTASSKSEHFVLSPEDYATAEEAGDIVAVVHSHPDASANPSEADRVGCELSGLPWYILSIGREPGKSPHFHGEFAMAPSGYQAPLVGREFHHGVLDCYALVKDYYDREMGIELSEYERTDGWWNRGENLYMKNLEKEGFYPIQSDEPMQNGDLIVMQVRAPEPNHAGVYVGDGLFLHHLYGRLSSRDVYGGYWREVTRIVVRHKDAKSE